MARRYPWPALAAVFSACLLLAGWAGPCYLAHVAKGQLSLLWHRRPIKKVLKDPGVAPRLKGLLSQIDAVKAFGSEHGLKPTPNFRDYVQLDRPAVTWVVSASKPLKFEPKVWSFPIAGSVTYLGWFDLKKASACAADLDQQGWDSDLRGASAYSTLGWFRDPVLSSMIADGPEAEGELAQTILHESLHATLYVKNQTAFDESLADWVGDRLAGEYLARKAGSEEEKAWLDLQQWRKRQAKFVGRAYAELETLYSSDKGEAEKKSGKEKVLQNLRQELGLRGRLNNASLIMEKSYESGGPELDLLFEVCGEDWSRFLGALKTLGPKSFARPQEDDFSSEINALSKADCPRVSR